jgi:hypothetical protein
MKQMLAIGLFTFGSILLLFIHPTSTIGRSIPRVGDVGATLGCVGYTHYRSPLSGAKLGKRWSR